MLLCYVGGNGIYYCNLLVCCFFDLYVVCVYYVNNVDCFG